MSNTNLLSGRFLLYAFISICITILPPLSKGMIPNFSSLLPLFIVNLIMVYLIGKAIFFIRNKQSAARRGSKEQAS